MVKKILVRLDQAIKYIIINTKMSLRMSNKIYMSGYSSAINIRYNSSDLLVFHQVFTFKEYGMDLGFVPKLIVDAGANIGLSAVFFSNKFPAATIIAVEPEESNFEMLLKNTKNYTNIFCQKKALANQSNISFDVIDKGYGNWGFVTEIKKFDQSQKVVNVVTTITLDDILMKNNLECIDLLKIDIEGAEKNLFECNYESWLPKTKCLIIELHDVIIKGSSKSFFAAISKYDFSYYNRGENLLFINNNL